jgi:RimJ/RimL family protein N-acetyltransferase
VADFEIVTPRLTLRRWRDVDCTDFAQMNADPQVTEFFPAPFSRKESDATVERFQSEFERRGFCPWAAVERKSNSFIGFVGLHEVPEYLSFAPAVEVGWRLARRFWGRGYATEGALSSLAFAFVDLGLDEVVSMTSVLNQRSRAVMERLGMEGNAVDDFEHPHIAEGHHLRAHVLYRITRNTWETRGSEEFSDQSHAPQASSRED